MFSYLFIVLLRYELLPRLILFDTIIIVSIIIILLALVQLSEVIIFT